MTLDPCLTHPSVPNVRDLAAQNTTLLATIDALVIELARARGVSEQVIRVRRGLPPGNPWVSRRQNTPETATVRRSAPLTADIRPIRPATIPDAPELDYAI